MEFMVDIRKVTKQFGSFVAVADVDLQIRTGEFLTLLGPSGCGKTTLLRMISGFEYPTRGQVLLDGEDVTYLPPYKRNVNQVFQSYALFPHQNVRDNIGFGLRMQNLAKDTIDERVREVVKLVSLEGMEDRMPHQLSGGQRQRVALARAIVPQPKVLLLDEPLSALDAKLRHQMQMELKRLQQRLKMTFVFVTHDQEEALTMSDRIAIINRGIIEQLGTSTEIYHSPKTTFVANFIGQANILESEVTSRSPGKVAVCAETGLTLTVAADPSDQVPAKHLVSIRPEKICLFHKPPGGGDLNVFRARIAEEIFRGQTAELLLVTDTQLELCCVVANESTSQDHFREGETVYCSIHPEDIIVLQDQR